MNATNWLVQTISDSPLPSLQLRSTIRVGSVLFQHGRDDGDVQLGEDGDVHLARLGDVVEVAQIEEYLLPTLSRLLDALTDSAALHLDQLLQHHLKSEQCLKEKVT